MKQLSARFVREVAQPGRYYDGDAGLFLLVKPTGSKSYVQRLTIRGDRRDIGLGSTRWTTLTEARALAQANRKVARQGGDPLAAKRATVPTFAEAAEAVLAISRDGWKDSSRSESDWRSTMGTYAARLGRKRVNEITTADVMAVLIPHWHAKNATMRRLRQRIGAVMKWSVAQGHREDNPAGDAIAAALPKTTAVRSHQRALPFAEVGAALDRVRASNASRATVAALEFLILTAARSGEVRGATWAEIDLEAATWTIPAERMKARREHRIPLSGRALEILDDVRELADGSGLIFPSPRGQGRLSDKALSGALRDLGIDSVPHGFRSSFRDWAAERSNAPREVCEIALAHVNSDRVEAAYRRTDLFERRRALMESWAAFLSDRGGVVVRIRG